jgi:sugar/nucleoside kinase (ribokinase family)
MYLVCGEALFDFFSENDPDGMTAKVNFKAIAGGSPFNVAVGLRRLGVEAALLGGLSTDNLGRRLLQVLQDEGVCQDYLQDFDAPTTLAMVAVGADGSPQYSFRGEGCADRQLQEQHLPTLVLAGGATHCRHLAGAGPAGKWPTPDQPRPERAPQSATRYRVLALSHRHAGSAG